MDRSYQGHTHMQQRQCSNANDRHACFFGAALASRPWSVCIPDHDSLDSRDGVIIPGSRVHYVCVLQAVVSVSTQARRGVGYRVCMCCSAVGIGFAQT